MPTRPDSSHYLRSLKTECTISFSFPSAAVTSASSAAVCIMIKTSPAGRQWNTVPSFTASKSPVRPQDICWKPIHYQASSMNFWATSGARGGDSEGRLIVHDVSTRSVNLVLDNGTVSRFVNGDGAATFVPRLHLIRMWRILNCRTVINLN